MQPLLTTEEVAGWLRVEVVTVRRLISRGELPAYRVGGEYRFKRSEVEDYLERQRVPAGEGGAKHLGKLTGRARTLLTPTPVTHAFEKFTGRARNVLALAQDEATRLNHAYIGTEHLLLGLIHEGEGVAARVLRDLGVELEAARSAVEQHVASGDDCAQKPRGEIGLTPRTKKVLELALEEARLLGHDYVGTEHVLLGLMREGEGVGARVLKEFGAELKTVRTRVAEVLASRS